MRRLAIVLCLVFSPLTAFAQSSLGSLPSDTVSYYNLTPPFTLVDYSHPAATAGTATFATLRWYSDQPTACRDAFKISVLRRSLTFPGYSTVATRGPFGSSTNGYLTVTLDPAINYERGDILAFTQLKPSSSCGSVGLGQTRTESVVVVVPSELPASGSLTGSMAVGGEVAMRLLFSRDYVDAVIPVAGSVAGSNGSFFRTSLQMTNRSDLAIHGKLVFHPAGRAPEVNDPSLPYSLQPNATVNYADVVAALNATGLGTIDIIPDRSATPIAVARIFNDRGAEGTQGFTEPMVLAKHALRFGEVQYFQQPADLNAFRMNVGVRTLDEDVQLRVRRYDANGVQVGDYVDRTYSARFFEQISLASFIGGDPIPGGSVRVSVFAGKAIVYASSTDNKTNDTTATFLFRD
ncbi:MAG: hypothetical protein M3Q69_12155 [Acidobacteriota bacterium]|nr:hypothetical protein [Acidobacteriota bacterium]